MPGTVVPWLAPRIRARMFKLPISRLPLYPGWRTDLHIRTATDLYDTLNTQLCC